MADEAEFNARRTMASDVFIILLPVPCQAMSRVGLCARFFPGNGVGNALSRLRRTVYSLFCPLVPSAAPEVARLLPHPVNEVTEGQDWMPVYHPGPGIPHHRADLIAHRGPVAMDRTPGALRLRFLAWASGEPFPGVIQELITIPAETFPNMILGAAMHPDHRLNSLALSC